MKNRIRKRNIYIFIGIGIVVLVLLGVVLWKKNQTEEYKAITYAIKESNYSLESVDVVDGHVIYALKGKDNYRNVKVRYEEYLKIHEESYLKKFPIEIFFCNDISDMTELGIANFIPKERARSYMFFTPDESGIHDEFDVTILSHLWWDDNYITTASNNEGTKTLIMDVSESNGDFLARCFNKAIDIYLPTDEFYGENLKKIEEEVLEVLPDCRVNSIKWILRKIEKQPVG